MKIKTKLGARRIRNQRVITRRFVTTDYTGCSYITAGKRYPLTRYGVDGELVTCDDGDNIEIISPDHLPTCGHLNGHTWRYVTI